MTTETAEPQTMSEVMDMGALLDLEAAQGGSLRRGEIVEGMVMGASPDGLIVDVGTKTEALIPQSEMLSLGADGASKLKTGDTVKVMVLQPSSSEGHAIVSLDRARGEEGWDVLAVRHANNEIFEGTVTGHNRGGILVNVEGVNAFIPLSQVDSVRRDDPDAVNQLANLVGKSIQLKVVELNRKRNRVILSERAAMADFRKEQKDKVLDDLQEGEIREGTVSSITDFGVFIDLGGADGLAHMTELTWERGKKAKDLYSVGETVQAYILKVDRETKKISLSLKRAQPEKWDTTVNRFVIGQILIGRVTKLMAFGAFVRLDGPVEGLIHISELSSRRIQHPKDVVKEGDIIPVKLVRIEKDRHRLGLSLRQARNDAEAMGFAFDVNGSVVDQPDDIREQFGLPPREKGAPRNEPPRTAQEAIERAVARDPEPVSAFAHAFAQALENAENGTAFARDGGAPADQAAAAPEMAAAPTEDHLAAMPADDTSAAPEMAATPAEEHIDAMTADDSAAAPEMAAAPAEEHVAPKMADDTAAAPEMAAAPAEEHIDAMTADDTSAAPEMATAPTKEHVAGMLADDTSAAPEMAAATSEEHVEAMKADDTTDAPEVAAASAEDHIKTVAEGATAATAT